MEKERLTREIIQKDLTRHSREGIGAAFIFGGVMIPLCCFLVYVTSLSRTIGVIERAAVWLMLAMAVLLFVMLLAHYIRQYRRMKRGHYRIVTDCVVDMTEPEFYSYNGHPHMGLFSGQKGLVFASFGEFDPGIAKRHRWSKKYSLTRLGELMYAHVGDEFYIITTDGKTILEAYNKRLFELAEEQ